MSSKDLFTAALGTKRGTGEPDYFTTPDGVRLVLDGEWLSGYPTSHVRQPYRGFEPWFHFRALRNQNPLPWCCEVWLNPKTADGSYEHLQALVALAEFNGELSVDGDMLDISMETLRDLHKLLDAVRDTLPDGAADAYEASKVAKHPSACETHCCPTHGCKYGERHCPVALGRLAPRYPNNNGCEGCEIDAEDAALGPDPYGF